MKGLLILNFINFALAAVFDCANETSEIENDQFESNVAGSLSVAAIPVPSSELISSRYSILPTIEIPREINDNEAGLEETSVEINSLKSESISRSLRKGPPKRETVLSVTEKLFPRLLVDKPRGFTNGSEAESTKANSGSEHDSQFEYAEELIGKIPERFYVDGTSGTYRFEDNENDEDDQVKTSADLMAERSALYRLLSEIYFFFDVMDLEGFGSFLRRYPMALNNQSLKYNLIDNLLARSLKTDNENTCEVLAEFIQLIDVASIAKTVGKEEKCLFKAFEKDIKTRKNSRGKSIQYPVSIYASWAYFSANERKRLNPLRDHFSAADYNSAQDAIQSSNNQIYITMDDYLFLLEQECSSRRYNFLVWAIRYGHFNVHEMLGDQLMTPLMYAAKTPKVSNDVVKAILAEDPSTVAEIDATGNKALHYALNNKYLSKKLRKPLIKMLQLEHPTNESLNHILDKYSE